MTDAHDRGAGRTRVRIHAPASYAGLKRIFDNYQRLAAAHQIPDTIRHDVYVASEELISNIIHHGRTPGLRPRVAVGLTLRPGSFTTTIADNGTPFNPLAVPPPDLDRPLDRRPIGGLGIHFVRRLMDVVRYRRHGDWNHVVLVKRLPDAG